MAFFMLVNSEKISYNILMQKYFFDSHFMKKVLWIAVPLMLQQLVSVSVNLVDNLMVGFLGDNALSAVAAVNRYYFIVNAAINGLTAAACVFIAQYYGAKDTHKMKQTFRAMLYTTCIIVFIFSLIAFFFPREIVAFFVKESELIDIGERYAGCAVFAFLPGAISFAIYAAMRAVGDMRTPLYCSVISVFVNATLNYIFIMGKFIFPPMGVFGAALATVIARLVELALACFSLHKGNYAFKTPWIGKLARDILVRIVRKALPLMSNEILWSFGLASLFRFYGTRGSAVLSGFAMAGTISDLFFTLFAGMAAATTVLISTPLGANELEKAQQNAYRMIGFSAMLAICFGIVMFLSRYSIPYLYASVSVAAQSVAQNFLAIQSFMFWIYMATVQCYFILRAGGDMKHTLMMDSGFMWAVNIPLVALVTYLTDIPYWAIYLLSQVTDLWKLLFAHHLVKKEHWLVNLTA